MSSVMLDKILRLLESQDREITALKNLPPPADGADGKDGKDGESPDVEEVARIVQARIPNPKDGESPDVEEVARIVQARIPNPKDGRDGRDGKDVNVEDVAQLVQSRIRVPKDGKDGENPDVEDVAQLVQSRIRVPKDGKDGATIRGPRGRSVTNIKLKDNKLLVALDGGKLEPVGEIDLRGISKYVSVGGGGYGRAPSRAELPINLKVINKASQFPAPVGGKIPLKKNTLYWIGDNVTITSPLDGSAGGCAITCGHPNGSRLTYTGTQPLLYLRNASFTILDAGMSYPNAALFDGLDNAPANSSLINIRNADLAGKTFGTLDSMSAVVIDNVSTFHEQGLRLLGSGWLVWSIIKVALVTASGAFRGVDFSGAQCGDIELQNIAAIGPAGSIAFYGDTGGANIPAGGSGFVSGCTFLQGIIPQGGGIDMSNDVRWAAAASSADLPDSMPGAIVFQRLNATPTIISGTTVNDAVKVAGVFSTKRTSKFATDATGKLTYIGEKPRVYPVTIDITQVPVLGNAQTVWCYLAVDGVVDQDSGVSISTDSNDPLPLTVTWEVTATQNQEFEVYVRNASSTNDILVTNVTFRIGSS